MNWPPTGDVHADEVASASDVDHCGCLRIGPHRRISDDEGGVAVVAPLDTTIAATILRCGGYGVGAAAGLSHLFVTPDLKNSTQIAAEFAGQSLFIKDDDDACCLLR